MILVDANIPMYAAGGEHVNKAPSVAFLDRVAAGDIEAAIDVEALQEILHRYRSLNRWPDGRRLYDLVRTVFGVILPVTPDIMDLARILLDAYQGLSARDALHIAVCQVRGCRAICSYDRDLDAVAEIRRIEP